VGALLDSAAYRRFLAETHPALAIDDARLGGVPSFLAPLDIREPLLPGPTRALLDAARGIVPRLVTPRALFVGTPFEPYDQTPLLEGLSSPGELTERARDAARREGCEVIVFTNLRPRAVDLAPWRSAGWVGFPSFPDTVVDLSPPSLEAHLARLPSGDRSGMRRTMRKFERAGHRLERIRDASGLGEDLYRCYLPFYEKAAVRWQAHTRAYFAGLTRLGEAVRLTAARTPEGRVIGFVVGFADADGMQAGRIGVHPNFHRKDAVYFRLLYHVLQEALEGWGDGAHLSLEPTGYRMKRHLGAAAVPLSNLVSGVSDTWAILLERLRGLGARMLRHLADPSVLERHY
jgi:hypothetical protein